MRYSNAFATARNSLAVFPPSSFPSAKALSASRLGLPDLGHAMHGDTARESAETFTDPACVSATRASAARTHVNVARLGGDNSAASSATYATSEPSSPACTTAACRLKLNSGSGRERRTTLIAPATSSGAAPEGTSPPGPVASDATIASTFAGSPSTRNGAGPGPAPGPAAESQCGRREYHAGNGGGVRVPRRDRFQGNPEYHAGVLRRGGGGGVVNGVGGRVRVRGRRIRGGFRGGIRSVGSGGWTSGGDELRDADAELAGTVAEGLHGGGGADGYAVADLAEGFVLGAEALVGLPNAVGHRAEEGRNLGAARGEAGHHLGLPAGSNLGRRGVGGGHHALVEGGGGGGGRPLRAVRHRVVEDSRQHVGQGRGGDGGIVRAHGGDALAGRKGGVPAEVGIDRRPRCGNRAVVGEGARGGHGECHPPSDRWRFSTGVLKQKLEKNTIDDEPRHQHLRQTRRRHSTTRSAMSSLCSPIVVSRPRAFLARVHRAAGRRVPSVVRCASSSSERPAMGRRDVIAIPAISAIALALEDASSPRLAEAATLSSPTDGPVLVVGATGATGRRVVQQLRARGVAVRAGARDVKKAQSLGLAAAGAEVVQMDVLDTDSIAAAMAGVSAVICATGFTPSLNFKKDNPAKVDHLGTDNLVAAAAAADVKRFILVTSSSPTPRRRARQTTTTTNSSTRLEASWTRNSRRS